MEKQYPMINVKKTGENIKNIMRIRGMTVKDVQAFLGLGTSQSIYHWFEGRSLPTLDNLYALSELFCLPMDVLIRGERDLEYRQINDTSYRRIMIYYGMFMQHREGYIADDIMM